MLLIGAGNAEDEALLLMWWLMLFMYTKQQGTNMKKLRYIPMVILFCLCIGVCAVGVYSLSTINANITGSVVITAGADDLLVDYGVEIVNAATSSEFTLEEPEKIYINSTNSASGELLELSDANKNVNLGNLFFSSHGEGIEDIQISITLKNNSLYPVLVNFALGDGNTIGVHSDDSLKEIYLSNESQGLGNSAVLYRDYGFSVYDFYLRLKNPTSDLSGTHSFELNISFSAATGAEDIASSLPVTYARMVDDRLVEYMEVAETTLITDFITSNRSKARECKPFTFDFTLPFGVTNSTFELSTNYEFKNAKIYNLTQNSITFENLFVGTNYFYRITFKNSKGQTGYKLGVIATEKTPRMLNIEGALNTRDIAGWQTSVNIKQGMVIRGTEIDGAVEATYLATEKGLNDLKELGIIVDFDLRNNTDATPISGATKLSFASPMYNYALTSEHNETMKAIFTELAKPANYPMYLHCTYGCDRTGTICYLLEALLGVSELELIIDYELSGLVSTEITRNREIFISFIGGLETLVGTTTQEKVTNYLLSIGITEAQIQSIKDILLED